MYAAAGNPLRPAAQREKDHLWLDTQLPALIRSHFSVHSTWWLFQ